MRLPASGMHPRDRDVPPRSRWRRRIAAALALAALALGAQAAWLPAKAELSQVLLKRSWDATREDGAAHRPWPWADTHAVARLRAPAHGIDQVVLAGDDGRALAFGPGWAASSAAPGAADGSTVISGHRDTHFAWLRQLAPGEALHLAMPAGERRYRVASTTVIDSRTTRLDPHAPGHRLVLVTCWPFDATAPRGPLRYVVTLVPASEGGGMDSAASSAAKTGQPRAAETSARMRAMTSA